MQSRLFGEPSTAHLIAAARLRRVSWGYVHLIVHADLGADPIPELEFDQTAVLRAEAGHDRLLHSAGVDAEPIPELEFDQTLEW